MRTTAGRQRLEKCFHASAAKLPAQYRSPGLVDRMDLKNVFGEIKTYNSNRHLDSPRNVALRLRPPYGIRCRSQRSSTPSPRGVRHQPAFSALWGNDRWGNDRPHAAGGGAASCAQAGTLGRSLARHEVISGKT